MTEEADEVQMVPLAAIRVLNPRARNKRSFDELVESIAALGLKKPITVSRRADGVSYDLVCGQGRLEAFVQLGQAAIPARVISASQDDCYIMSLVENIARRSPGSFELVQEIERLRERGYSITQIAEKTAFSPVYIGNLLYLLDHGERRLLTAVEKGIVPHTIAIEIAKANGTEIQLGLIDAYESKALTGTQISAIRRIIEARKRLGKSLSGGGKGGNVTTETLVRTFRKEADRQKLLVKQATLARNRLIFIVNAFKRLLADAHFVTLLRAETMQTMPKELMDKVGVEGEA